MQALSRDEGCLVLDRWHCGCMAAGLSVAWARNNSHMQAVNSCASVLLMAR